jgi:DNA sulfur modification protein DndE
MLSEMHFNEEASRKLSQMKGRTGLTPNVLARIGFCLSLEDPEPIDTVAYEGVPGHVSIKWHVLTGSHERLLVALFEERCYQDHIPEEMQHVLFKAHMNRGALLLNKQLKSLNRLLYLLPKDARLDEAINSD